MSHKRDDNIGDLHVAFITLLELRSADVSSAAETFKDRWAAAKRSCHKAHDGNRDDYRAIVYRTVIRMGLVSASEDGRLQPTPEGTTWSQVFHMRLDGTFVVFGSSIDSQVWQTFHAALDTLRAELQELQHALTRYLGGKHTT